MKRIIVGILLFLLGCNRASSLYTYRHAGIDFGANLSVTAQEGIYDGCETARGFYRKDHRRFRYNEAYRLGWYEGRKRCEPLRKAAS